MSGSGVIVAVAHDEFLGIGVSDVNGFLGVRAVVVDVKIGDEISYDGNGVFKR